MLAMDGGGYDGGGKTGQRADFHDAARSEDADHRRQKEVIARADAARIPRALFFDHGAKKIEFAGGRNFAGIPELRGELAILDFKLLEGIELADVEAAAVGRQRIICESAFYYPGDLEAASARGVPQRIQIAGKRQFQNLK